MAARSVRRAVILVEQLSNRTFGLVFVTLFCVITGVAWLVFGRFVPWAAATAAALLFVSLAVPGLLLPLNRAWSHFAHRVSQVSNFVLLGLFFWLFVVPLGLVLRLFRWDSMQRRFDAEAQSYLQPVDQRATVDVSRDMF